MGEFCCQLLLNVSMLILYVYTAVYVAFGVGLFFRRRESVQGLIKRTVSNTRSAVGTSSK